MNLGTIVGVVVSEIKLLLRQKYSLPIDTFIIGSAQRDTEGSSISTGQFLPKLEKGPDLFASFIQEFVQQPSSNMLEGLQRLGFELPLKPIHVVLAGWRRQYLINRLKAAQISFSYYELPSQSQLNELYQSLDLYVVTARHEGGPQSLIECGLLGVPVVSTPVGMAEQVLPASAIRQASLLLDATPAVPNVKHLTLPVGYEPYRRLIESL